MQNLILTYIHLCFWNNRWKGFWRKGLFYFRVISWVVGKGISAEAVCVGWDDVKWKGKKKYPYRRLASSRWNKDSFTCAKTLVKTLILHNDFVYWLKIGFFLRFSSIFLLRKAANLQGVKVMNSLWITYFLYYIISWYSFDWSQNG